MHKIWQDDWTIIALALGDPFGRTVSPLQRDVFAGLAAAAVVAAAEHRDKCVCQRESFKSD